MEAGWGLWSFVLRFCSPCACREERFQFAQALRQFREAREPAVLLFEFIDRTRRSAPDGLRAANRLARWNAGLRAGDRAVFHCAVIGDADLPSDHHALPDGAAAGDSGLRGNHGVLADA